MKVFLITFIVLVVLAVFVAAVSIAYVAGRAKGFEDGYCFEQRYKHQTLNDDD